MTITSTGNADDRTFEVQEDVWIDHLTKKVIKEEDAVNGAARIEAGTMITPEEAETYGLTRKAKVVDAVKSIGGAPENKAVTSAGKK